MTRVLALLLTLALFVPATAVAQAGTTNAPPGNSAIDEYLETVPGASGNTVPRPPGGGGGRLTRAQRQRLEQQGADGRALAKVVDATSPAPRKRPTTTGAVNLPDAKGRSPLGEIVSVATGDGGMGMLLPAILLASLLTAIALVLARRRSPS